MGEVISTSVEWDRPALSLVFANMSVEHARRAMAAHLKSAGIDSAELDARLLVGGALGLDLTGMIAAIGRTVTADEAQRLVSFMQRRLAFEPVARILDIKEFWGLTLQLSPATLVPRPDTETVVELALETARDARQIPARIADIGTGSGAILLALLHEWRGTHGVGTDLSLDALATARWNAKSLGLAPRATFVACNYAAALSGSFDLVVSNPPYIRSSEIAGLDQEVRDFDPPLALNGGADGLDAYRALIPQVAGLLAPGGALIVEVGSGQSGPIFELMRASGLTTERPAKADLAGIPRAVMGRKMPR